MKTSKKIFSLVLATVMAMSMTACGSKTPDEPEKNEEEAVRKVLEKFYAGKDKKIREFDDLLENIEEYIEPESELYEEGEKTIDGMNQLVNSFVQRGVSQNTAENLLITFTNEGQKRTEREIKEIEIDGDKATITVEVEKLGDDAFDELNNLITQEAQAYVSQRYNMTYDQFKTQLSQQPVETQKSVAIAVNEAANKNATNKIGEVLKSVKTKSVKSIVTLKKVDDTWFITEIEDK